MCKFAYHGLGEGPRQGKQQCVHPPAAMDGGVHHVPRMHCIRRDTPRGKAAVQLVGEENVTEFGPVVCQHGPIVVL